MRLCITTHSFAKGSGQGRVNYEIVEEAIRQGHSLTLIGSDIALELEQHPQVSWIPIAVAKWPTEFVKNIIFSARATRYLRRHQQEFDVIKINGAIAAVAASVNAVHFVHHSWLKSPAHTFRVRRDLYGLYQWLYTAINAYWEKQAFRRARVVVAVSDAIAKELIGLGVPPEHVEVIVNGVDLEEFSPGIADRAALGLPENVPIALFAGDIQTSRKNLDTVLAALAQAPNLHIAIAGRTEGSPYPKMAEQLDIFERTHFLGYRRDISNLMKAVDFLVYPSRYEPWGLVLVEAMASGIPVITAASVGAAEVVTPESGVVIDDPNDTQALAQAMINLANDPQSRQAMGRAARTIAELLSWESMAKQYLHLFEILRCQ